MALSSLSACGAGSESEDAGRLTSELPSIKRSTMYGLRGAFSGKCLDVSGGSLWDGARIQQWTCNGTHARVSWKFYGTNFDGLFSENWSMLDASSRIRNNPAQWAKVVNEAQLSQDLQNRSLPNVTWLVDQDQYSEHPDVTVPGLNLPLDGVCAGEGWTVKCVNQLMQNDYWKDTAIFITWDDFGGWHDHVPPPRQYGGSPDAPYGLGFRLPLLIVSPYAKPGFVFHEVAGQASLTRFVERVFGSSTTLHELDPAVQDHEANDLLAAFDFTQSPLPPVVRTPRSCPPSL